MTDTLVEQQTGMVQKPAGKSEATLLGELFAARGMVLSRKELLESLAKLATARNAGSSAVPGTAPQAFINVPDEERFLVGEFWGHCFVEGKESEVRFVVDRLCGSMVYCEVYDARQWKRCSSIQCASVLGFLYDNDVLVDPTQWDELNLSGRLPYWAALPLTLSWAPHSAADLAVR
jgi:hypothetical protein